MFDFIKNKTVFANKYKTNSEAIIISCFFNPQNSPYRIKAFNEFYKTIKHLNHSIIECVIGNSKPQLEENKNIKRVYTENLLWHKEALLNKLVSELPKKYKYIFWVDTDVLFSNLNWMVDGVNQLKTNNIIQPFDLCVHLNKDEMEPSFNISVLRHLTRPNQMNPMVWKSFCSNYVNGSLWKSDNYNDHGHVGFAWGARREILDAIPLYDKALIGGADHIIAHASTGQIPCNCITKSFTDNIDEVNEWSKKFYNVIKGKIGYVDGDLYHIWHGDIDKRQYLQRIRDFTTKTKDITIKDENGLYVTNKHDDQYMKNYFKQREVTDTNNNQNHGDNGFLSSLALGYLTNNTLLGGMLGGNYMGAAIGSMLNTSETHDNNSNVPIDNISSNSNNSPDLSNIGTIVGEAASNITPDIPINNDTPLIDTTNNNTDNFS